MDLVEVLEYPVKSENDKKEYRAVKLSNGLQAFLISKPDETNSENENNAAACMVVGVGSFDDPMNIGGLAHFLEHMLFMGSEKYPEESGYNDFVTANGGENNAMTENEHTVYYFDVSEKAFPEALDRFGQQFIKPLLLKNAIQRERESVDSEFQMAEKVDEVRITAFRKTLIRDDHPASNFDYGNSVTLKDNITDDELFQAVQDLFQKYNAKNMFLSVQSSRGLDEIQKLVVEIFSEVKSGETTTRIHESVDEIFKPQFHTKMFFVKPIADTNKLIMTWALDSAVSHYKCRPLVFMKAIFSNDGEGGLEKYLGEKNLAISTGFEIIDILSTNTIFDNVNLNVNLTDFGLQNIDKVLEAIFSYLLMIQEASIDNLRRLYEDYKIKAETSFKFAKELDSSANTGLGALGLKYFGPVDAIIGLKIFQEFNENVIRNYIDAFNQRKFNLVIETKNHEKFDKTEKYFGVEYDEVDFPERYQKLWDERRENPEFFLEKPNPFKAENFEIFVRDGESPKYPVKIIDNDKFEVWHKLDDKFKQPRGFIDIHIISPKYLKSSYNIVLFCLLRDVLRFSMAKKVFAAKSAGLNCSFSSTKKGLKIQIDGFNDKMLIFLETALQSARNILDNLDESIFEAQKTLAKSDAKSTMQSVRSLSRELLENIFVKDSLMTFNNYKEIDRISFEDLQKFALKFFKKIKIHALIQGNLTKSQAEEVAAKIEKHFEFQPIDYEYELKLRGYQLPLGCHILRVKSLMPNDDNSRITNVYEIGPDSIRNRNSAKLLESILEPKSFDFLRNKNQLGYSVGSVADIKADVIRINVFVTSQEDKHSSQEVFEKMEIFWNEIARKAIEELSDEEFDNVKTSRIKYLSANDLQMRDEATRNWSELEKFNFQFDRRELLIEDLKSLSKTDLQNFFESFSKPENWRKLSIQAIGKQEDDSEEQEWELKILTEKQSEEEKLITNVEDFKKTLIFYEI